MEMPDFANLTAQEKTKLGVAVGMLVVALFLIYWFGIRTPAPATTADVPPAPVDGSVTPDGPPPAANRRVDPSLLKGKSN